MAERWRQAMDAQVEGDHAAAAAILAEVAATCPDDAEARFAAAVARGWATTSAPDLDGVIVGIGAALELASPPLRADLRTRAARALCVLAESAFHASEQKLADGDPTLDAALAHVGQGYSTLRALDAALELDPHFGPASEATIRTVDAVVTWQRLLEASPSACDLAASLGGRAVAPPDGMATLARRRERAIRHLGALDRIHASLRDTIVAPVVADDGPTCDRRLGSVVTRTR